MATTAKSLAREPYHGDRSVSVCSWAAMPNGDDGDPLQVPGSARLSVQVEGTFGVGGAIVIEGSNDGTNYHTLNDEAGSAISLSAAGLVSIREQTKFIRPRVTGGDGTTALDVTLVAALRF